MFEHRQLDLKNKYFEISVGIFFVRKLDCVYNERIYKTYFMVWRE
jgi:hypothetical protein